MEGAVYTLPETIHHECTVNTSIKTCGQKLDIGTQVVTWTDSGGLPCPNPRGRQGFTQHPPALNDAPTREPEAYKIRNTTRAYEELKQRVHQLVLHYDACYCSHHCHQVLKDSSFLGSHFYLDLDGTLYQTCDLYWKTNTGPGDDGRGNDRAVHVEIANLGPEALVKDAELYQIKQDQYRVINGQWELALPGKFRDTLRTPGFKARPARTFGERGYFSRTINGKTIRMWDFTEEQYQSLIQLCLGIHRLLPKIKLRIPFSKKLQRIPLDRIDNFSSFSGILGHSHIQKGTRKGIHSKYDPGSAFDWGRLKKAIENQERVA